MLFLVAHRWPFRSVIHNLVHAGMAEWPFHSDGRKAGVGRFFSASIHWSRKRLSLLVWKQCQNMQVQHRRDNSAPESSGFRNWLGVVEFPDSYKFVGWLRNHSYLFLSRDSSRRPSM